MKRQQKRWYAQIKLTGEGNLSVYPDNRAAWEDSIGSPHWRHGYCHDDMSGFRMFWRAEDCVNHKIASGVAWSYFNVIVRENDDERIPF